MQPTSEDMVSVESPRRRHWSATLLWLTPVFFFLAAILYGMLTRPPVEPGSPIPQVGQPVPDFTLPDLHGNRVHLSTLRGKVVFINVWATWCPPCIEEMPTMQQLYERFHDRGLEILAVSIDPLGAQIVAPFMQEHRLAFTTLLDPEGKIEPLYHTNGVPESFIVDKRGLLVEKIVGPRDWSHPQVTALFERLLAEPASGP